MVAGVPVSLGRPNSLGAPLRCDCWTGAERDRMSASIVFSVGPRRMGRREAAWTEESVRVGRWVGSLFAADMRIREPVRASRERRQSEPSASVLRDRLLQNRVLLK